MQFHFSCSFKVWQGLHKSVACFQTFLSDTFNYSITIMKWNKMASPFKCCANQWCAPATRWQQALECRVQCCCVYFSLKWEHSRTQTLHNIRVVRCSGGCQFTLRHNSQHISEVFCTPGVLVLAANCLKRLHTSPEDNKALQELYIEHYCYGSTLLFRQDCGKLLYHWTLKMWRW